MTQRTRSTVMVELHTRYLGLDLPSPLVASASPLTGTLDGLRRLETAGAAAVVLPSLFEEQLTLEADQVGRLLESWGGQPVGGAGPGRLQRRPVRLPGPGRKGQGHPPDPGDRQPQRRRPRRLGQARQPAGGGRRRRPGTQHLLRVLQPQGGRPRGRAALPRAGRFGAPDHRHPAGGQAQPVFQLSRQPDPPAGPGGRRRAGAVQPLLPARPGLGDPGGHPSPGPVDL